MGCVQGRSAQQGDGGTITLGGYGGATQRKGQGYQTMAPDPDLGWRRLPNSVAIPMGGVATGAVCTNPTEWTSSSPNPRRQQRGAATPPEMAPLYPHPHSWTVCFFNDRSGHFCNISLITLAINMAIRAENLASTFGITNDPEAYSQRTSSLVSVHNVDEDDTQNSQRKIYSALRVPDFGWRLLNRRSDAGPSAPRDGQRRAVTGKRRVSRETIPAPVKPQLIQRGMAGEPVWADIPEIGMNIAEQLYRLERRKDNRNFLPTDMFGWRFSEMEIEEEFRIAVSSPEGDAYWLVPEELIMNVTQWVQQTYLTSTAF